ncbi:MAG TPA: biotin/lipoyl-binding protein, partial [Chloroflexota bacterium]|nr:biotin/lipoyl-binding protein [Chloroflexota bacterium]
MIDAPSLPARAWHWRWRILLALVVVGLTGFALLLTIRKGQQPLPPAVASGPQPIIAQAQVVPTQERKLAFQTPGRVKDVKVSVGQSVKAGDVLARLETADLELKVSEARANLDLQKATVAKSAEPPAASDVAAAKADLASATAHEKQVESGADAADLKTAQEAVAADQAALANAQAQLQKVTAGPTASDIAGAEASVRSAQAQLATAKQKLADTQARPLPDDVNAAKLAVEQAKDTLWSTQVSRDATCGQTGSDSAPCKSANASVGAQETAVKTAEANLDKASKPATPEELAAAQQGVQSAQAGLTSAQADLAKVKAGATAADRASAQAQVDQAAANLRSAQAKLAQLQAGSTASDLAAAKSAVADAQAKLDKLIAPPSQNTVDLGSAQV